MGWFDQQPGIWYGREARAMARLIYQALTVYGPLSVKQLRVLLGIVQSTAPASRIMSGVLGSRVGALLKNGDQWSLPSDLQSLPTSAREEIRRVAKLMSRVPYAQFLKFPCPPIPMSRPGPGPGPVPVVPFEDTTIDAVMAIL